MVDLLQHYGLLEGLKQQRGEGELVGLCPFHSERRGSFHVSTVKQAWNCFGCHRHGNILDLVAHTEDVTIREAALLIDEWFPQSGDAAPTVANATKDIKKSPKAPQR